MSDVDRELAQVLGVLPASATAVPLTGPDGPANSRAVGVAIKHRPWAVDIGPTRAVLRRNDPGRFRAQGLGAAESMESVEWLHSFLRDLAASGFVAPVPRTDLGGRSAAVVDGAIWELLTYVPGVPIGRSDADLIAAGALLARFHLASLRCPPRRQRPGALPVIECRPIHPEAGSIRARFDRALTSTGHHLAPHGVVHGDATDANVVCDAGGACHLIDYAVAQIDAVLFDVGSALWRNARPDVHHSDYDPERVELFVSGYASVRPLTATDARVIVMYMLGRGLQLQRRLELRGGRDDSVMERLLRIATLDEKLTTAALRGCCS